MNTGSVGNRRPISARSIEPHFSSSCLSSARSFRACGCCYHLSDFVHEYLFFHLSDFVHEYLFFHLSDFDHEYLFFHLSDFVHEYHFYHLFGKTCRLFTLADLVTGETSTSDRSHTSITIGDDRLLFSSPLNEVSRSMYLAAASSLLLQVVELGNTHNPNLLGFICHWFNAEAQYELLDLRKEVVCSPTYCALLIIFESLYQKYVTFEMCLLCPSLETCKSSTERPLPSLGERTLSFIVPDGSLDIDTSTNSMTIRLKFQLQTRTSYNVILARSFRLRTLSP